MVVDWGTLVSQNRAKAFGIPWSDKEWTALKSGIPADYIREGILNLNDYEKRKGNISIQSKDDLLKEAKELGIDVFEDAYPEVIKLEIEKEKLRRKISNNEETKIKTNKKKIKDDSEINIDTDK